MDKYCFGQKVEEVYTEGEGKHAKEGTNNVFLIHKFVSKDKKRKVLDDTYDTYR